ncbi:LysR family transcriptional regulator [Paenibacillus sp. 1P07SE]|uniref:LysR family transcriptional regulator n=1 Tax=Paenibacillus sp. 1P07SE TaxID=3132209 RepID=UPI0039A58D0B
MNYLALRYFVEIGHTLNFSRAAENLHISQPGLSQQISALEKELGFKLLQRSTRKVAFTEEGQYLYHTLLTVFDNLERTILEMKQAGTIPQPVLRIATVPSAASRLVPILIRQLKAYRSGLEFFIKETTSTHAVELLQRGEFHLAFIRTPIDLKQSIPSTLAWMEFPKHPLRLVVSASHPAASQEEVELSAFKHDNFLHYDPKHSPALYYLVELACLNAGFMPKTIGAGPEILTLANLISNGTGIALMPEDMLDLLAAYPITGLRLKNASLYSSISVLWNEPVATLFMEQALRTLRQIREDEPQDS